MSISGYVLDGGAQPRSYEISDYYYAGDNETEQVILIQKDRRRQVHLRRGLLRRGCRRAERLAPDAISSPPSCPTRTPSAIGDLGVGVLELQNGSIEALAVAKGNAEMIIDSNPDLDDLPVGI